MFVIDSFFLMLLLFGCRTMEDKSESSHFHRGQGERLGTPVCGDLCHRAGGRTVTFRYRTIGWAASTQIVGFDGQDWAIGDLGKGQLAPM